MSQLPHSYRVTAQFSETDGLRVRSGNVPEMAVAPPVQFGGPGDMWSPEDLQMAALSSCLILSFKAIAAASRLAWHTIECDCDGTLAKHDGKVYFTEVRSAVRLHIAAAADKAKAERLVHKADETCFISNSLLATPQLRVEISAADEAE